MVTVESVDRYCGVSFAEVSFGRQHLRAVMLLYSFLSITALTLKNFQPYKFLVNFGSVLYKFSCEILPWFLSSL
jgi:hypothetical protein